MICDVMPYWGSELCLLEPILTNEHLWSHSNCLLTDSIPSPLKLLNLLYSILDMKLGYSIVT